MRDFITKFVIVDENRNPVTSSDHTRSIAHFPLFPLQELQGWIGIGGRNDDVGVLDSVSGHGTKAFVGNGKNYIFCIKKKVYSIDPKSGCRFLVKLMDPEDKLY